MRYRITITVAGLVLAGCGGESGNGDSSAAAAAAATELDPCSLLSGEDVARITTDKVSKVDRNGATCRYRSEPNDGVEIVVRASGGAEQMDIARRTAKLLGGIGNAVADKSGAGADVNAMLDAGASAAPALGDEALWQANDTLAVRKGDAFIEVTPPLMHDPADHAGNPLIGKEEKRNIATKVAAALLDRLSRRRL